MPHHAASHQGLHCKKLKIKTILSKLRAIKKYFIWKLLTCDPSNFIMNHPKFILSTDKEEYISA